MSMSRFAAFSRRVRTNARPGLIASALLLLAAVIAAPALAWGPGETKLTLSPGSATNPVGTSHTVTAKLSETTDSSAIADARVVFSVSGANTASGHATTNASGEAQFSYTGDVAGNDSITA